MELRRIIRTDIAASAIAHLSLVAVILVVSEVRPFHTPPIETVSVDIVTPDELKEKATDAPPTPETPKQDAPKPELRLPEQKDKTDKTEKDKTAAASKSSPPPRSSQAATQPEPPKQQPPQPQSQPPQQAAQQAPSYTPPEPDVTVKYGVMLGLPEPLSLPEPKEGAKDNGGDARDSVATKLPPEIIAQFRRHLRTCAKLPAGVSPSDDLRIRLRAVMASNGTLARPPILIEAPPSAKGPLLVQSAMAALQACQPYKMLPVDKYEEWKVLDLPFTPRDFGGA